MKNQLLIDDIAGDYFLDEDAEAVSGLRLNDDLTFLFFFTYSGMERFSTGTWLFKNGQLILNSRPRPEKDFRLVESKVVADNKITIKITGDNALYASYVLCTVKSQAAEQKALTDENGIASFPQKNFESISLLFQLCPERASDFIIDKKYNFFEFQFEPWICEVFFKDHAFLLEKDVIAGTHSVLPAKHLKYLKRNDNEAA